MGDFLRTKRKERCPGKIWQLYKPKLRVNRLRVIRIRKVCESVRFDSGPEVFVRVNRNYVLTECVLNENDCISKMLLETGWGNQCWSIISMTLLWCRHVFYLTAICPMLTFWTRGTYYYVMEIDAVPRRTYYYVLDLHGFNGPAQVSVVHDWTPTWTRGLAMSHCALRRKKVVDSTSETGVSNACVFSDFQRYCTKGAWLHASFAGKTSSKHMLQTM